VKKCLIAWVAALVVFGCQDGASKTDTVTLTLGAYTVPKEAYQKAIIPAFKKLWRERTGQEVEFAESYIASGAQSRAILAGFEADIAALSLEHDVERLREAGLITHDWKTGEHGGFITESLVVIAHRPGNPKGISDWESLTGPEIDVIYPSPKTSGGAMWFVNAIYGAGLKKGESRGQGTDPGYARSLLKRIQSRVRVMDSSGRASVTTFENGIGDALLTYENEALLRQKQGRDFPFIIPGATILIENPIALIDKNLEKHGNRAVAEAFLKFLHSAEAQRHFAEFGFRPVDTAVKAEFEAKYPVPDQLFNIQYLGGWTRVSEEIYGENGIWPIIVQEIANE